MGSVSVSRRRRERRTDADLRCEREHKTNLIFDDDGTQLKLQILALSSRKQPSTKPASRTGPDPYSISTIDYRDELEQEILESKKDTRINHDQTIILSCMLDVLAISVDGTISRSCRLYLIEAPNEHHDLQSLHGFHGGKTDLEKSISVAG
jgi:hypothetical protein